MTSPETSVVNQVTTQDTNVSTTATTTVMSTLGQDSFSRGQSTQRLRHLLGLPTIPPDQRYNGCATVTNNFGTSNAVDRFVPQGNISQVTPRNNAPRIGPGYHHSASNQYFHNGATPSVAPPAHKATYNGSLAFEQSTQIYQHYPATDFLGIGTFYGNSPQYVQPRRQAPVTYGNTPNNNRQAPQQTVPSDGMACSSNVMYPYAFSPYTTGPNMLSSVNQFPRPSPSYNENNVTTYQTLTPVPYHANNHTDQHNVTPGVNDINIQALQQNVTASVPRSNGQFSQNAVQSFTSYPAHQVESYVAYQASEQTATQISSQGNYRHLQDTNSQSSSHGYMYQNGFKQTAVITSPSYIESYSNSIQPTPAASVSSSSSITNQQNVAMNSVRPLVTVCYGLPPHQSSVPVTKAHVVPQVNDQVRPTNSDSVAQVVSTTPASKEVTNLLRVKITNPKLYNHVESSSQKLPKDVFPVSDHNPELVQVQQKDKIESKSQSTTALTRKKKPKNVEGQKPKRPRKGRHSQEPNVNGFPKKSRRKSKTARMSIPGKDNRVYSITLISDEQQQKPTTAKERVSPVSNAMLKMWKSTTTKFKNSRRIPLQTKIQMLKRQESEMNKQVDTVLFEEGKGDIPFLVDKQFSEIEKLLSLALNTTNSCTPDGGYIGDDPLIQRLQEEHQKYSGIKEKLKDYKHLHSNQQLRQLLRKNQIYIHIYGAQVYARNIVSQCLSNIASQTNKKQDQSKLKVYVPAVKSIGRKTESGDIEGTKEEGILDDEGSYRTTLKTLELQLELLRKMRSNVGASTDLKILEQMKAVAEELLGKANELALILGRGEHASVPVELNTSKAVVPVQPKTVKTVIPKLIISRKRLEPDPDNLSKVEQAGKSKKPKKCRSGKNRKPMYTTTVIQAEGHRDSIERERATPDLPVINVENVPNVTVENVVNSDIKSDTESEMEGTFSKANETINADEESEIQTCASLPAIEQNFTIANELKPVTESETETCTASEITDENLPENIELNLRLEDEPNLLVFDNEDAQDAQRQEIPQSLASLPESTELHLKLEDDANSVVFDNEDANKQEMPQSCATETAKTSDCDVIINGVNINQTSNNQDSVTEPSNLNEKLCARECSDDQSFNVMSDAHVASHCPVDIPADAAAESNLIDTNCNSLKIRTNHETNSVEEPTDGAEMVKNGNFLVDNGSDPREFIKYS